jgi:hypothetical protein
MLPGVSDAALREAERTWRASGAVEDEARLLLARVRAGALHPGRLELAAWLGHRAAREALGPDAPAGEHMPWERWGRAVDDAGVQLLLRLERERRQERDAGLPAFGAEWLARWDELAAAAARRDAAAVEAVERASEARRDELDAGDDIGGLLAWGALSSAASGVEEFLEGRGARSLLASVADVDAPPRPPLIRWALGEPHAAEGAAPTLEEEVAWLRTRLERGELDERRVRVAFHGGHPPAAALLGLPPPAWSVRPPPPSPPDYLLPPEPTAAEVTGWLEELHRLDPDVSRCVVANWAWETGLDLLQGPDETALRAAVEELLPLGLLPRSREDAAERAAALLVRLRSLEQELRTTGWRRLVAPLARRLVERAPDAARALAPRETERLWLQGARAACQLVLDPQPGLAALRSLWAVTPPFFREHSLARMRERAVRFALDA